MYGYLRARQGDADTIAPSLYPGRPRRRGTEEPAITPPEVNTGVPAAPLPATPAVAAAAAAPAAANNALVAKNGPFAS